MSSGRDYQPLANGESAPKKPYYGGTVTVNGRDLITSLVAGETIEFTRIVVGSGAMPGGVEPIDMTDLVEPIAEATSTVPIVENNIVSLVVEYRNDMNGGLKKGFWLREFGIYARTNERGEILLYYATLGDSPQPVSPFDGNRVDIRRYPVTIALALDAKVEVTYNPGAFMTAAEARELINALVARQMGATVDQALTAHNTDPAAHPDIRAAMAALAAQAAAQAALKLSLTIPKSAWEKAPDGFDYRARVPHKDVRNDHDALVFLGRAERLTAVNCGMDSYAETSDGVLVFWSKTVPDKDIAVVAVLFGSGGSGGTAAVITNHGDLTGRDAAQQHPISSITGLEAAMAAKLESAAIGQAMAENMQEITQQDIADIWNKI